MMKVHSFLGQAAAVTCVSFLVVGCADRVTQSEVKDAQQKVAEEKQETQQAEHDANQAIAEKKEELDEARHEAMKPVTSSDSAVQEKQDELIDTIRDENKAVEEEKEETLEAASKADKLEAELNAEKARDAYVKTVEDRLKAADQRVDDLRKKGENLTGPDKDENDLEISQILDRRERVSDTMEKLQAKPVLQWQQMQPDVERAVKDLDQELQESSK